MQSRLNESVKEGGVLWHMLLNGTRIILVPVWTVILCTVESLNHSGMQWYRLYLRHILWQDFFFLFSVTNIYINLSVSGNIAIDFNWCWNTWLHFFIGYNCCDWKSWSWNKEKIATAYVRVDTWFQCRIVSLQHQK